MADKNTLESKLADEVHRREYDVAQALSQPAGAGRLDRIAKADTDLLQAQADYTACLTGSGTRVPFKR